MNSMITCMVGTNKPGDNAGVVAETVRSIYTALEIPTEVLDLAWLPPEVFSPRSYRELPPSLGDWIAQLKRSTGLIVIAPEYSGGVPGVLKYLFDVLASESVLKSKPVCFIGLSADAGGGARAVQQLQQTCSSQMACGFLGCIYLPWINAKGGCNGSNVEPETRSRLQHQAMAFIEFCRQVNAPLAETGAQRRLPEAEAVD